MPPNDPRLIEVALPIPLFRTFTYAVDRELAHPVVAGSRVVVPLRGGKEVGICLGPAVPLTGKAVPKGILDVPDAAPAFDAARLAVCRWIADYYVAPLGVVLRSALPASLTGAAAPQPAVKTRRIASLGRDLPSLLQRERIFARAPQQRALYELLESLGGSAPVEHVLEQLGCSPSVLKGLIARGLASVADEVVSRDPFASRALAAPAAHDPTAAQRAAIDALVGGSPGEVFLLHGITGSGKTLVYIELLKRIVSDQGRTAIVLVPEIALTPQTVDRFRSVFGDDVAVLHSALSDGERYDAWLALRRGERRIAVGARSAIFAPLTNVGAIIVDEEHESSYKQGEAPRYHAREVAIMRAREEGAVVVLGSATPSLESWVNAMSGKFTLLSLPERVGGGRLPSVEVIDLRRPEAGVEPARATDRAAPGLGGGTIAPELEEALAERLDRKEQSILLLNRRGYAAFVQCRDCGDVATCPDCSITLTYHRTPESLVCHYCMHKEPPRPVCARCGGATMRQRGMGTQQVERIIADRFPSARIARMDVDTT